MNRSESKRPIDVVVVGQTPPPYHGQSIMIQMLVDGPLEGVTIHHVRMAFSSEIGEVGRFQLRKITHLFSLVFQIIAMALRHPGAILFYPPAGPNRVPLIRDVFLLGCTRWLFRKTVFHFHANGVSELIPKMPFWMQPLIRWSLFYPDAAIQLSKLTSNDAQFLKAKRTYIVPNAVRDVSPKYRRDRSWTGSAEPTQLLYVGTVCESKGIYVLLDACKQLRDQGVDFQLEVVGGFQPQAIEQSVRDRVREFHLEEQVSLRGQLIGDDKWQAFAAADVFCFPSHYESEGFPCVLLEAMSFELPVVSTRWRGIPSIVEHDVHGYLIDIKSHEQLATYVSMLASHPVDRARLGEAARQRFVNEFTDVQHLRMMAAVFHDLS